MKAGLPIQADTDICLHKWHHQRDQRGVHAWPLLTVETEVNEVSKRTNERGPFLAGALGLPCWYKRFFFSFGFSSRPITEYIFPYHTIFQFLCPHPIAQQAGQAAVLGRLPLIVCLW